MPWRPIGGVTRAAKSYGAVQPFFSSKPQGPLQTDFWIAGFGEKPMSPFPNRRSKTFDNPPGRPAVPCLRGRRAVDDGLRLS